LTGILKYGSIVYMNQPQSAYEEIVRIQPRGVITIPRQFRDKGFGERSFVKIKKVSGCLVLEPVTMLGYSVRRYSDQEVDEFLKLDKEESEELKRKGILKK